MVARGNEFDLGSSAKMQCSFTQVTHRPAFLGMTEPYEDIVQVRSADNHGIMIFLDQNSAWTVTGTSYITVYICLYTGTSKTKQNQAPVRFAYRGLVQ